ncbi:MAG: PLP-dependent aminotransferase family protein [Clostridia bacterium]|nr:PLP-dependent aminotransferase family protein [Clostridia bacterium]
MKYQIDPSLSKSVYLQLYEGLREDIVEGNYTYGTKLPSKRTLAEELGISLVTVEHAYVLLCEEGYAEARQRSGYFVSFREEDTFSTPAFSKSKEIIFEKTEPNLYKYPFSSLAKAMRKVLSVYSDALLEKSEGKGDPLFREEICRYLARSRGISATKEQIVIGAGAEYLYTLAYQLVGKGKKIALEKPSYEKIPLVYEAQGARVEHLPLGPEGIESQALNKSNADVLHITPYRSFPSGVTASASKKREYLRFADQKGRFLVEDDFESEFTLSKKPEDTLFSMAKKENVIYVNTFTKTISPSIRVGYMVLPKSLVGLFDEKLGFYSCTVPLFEQMVLKEIIGTGEFERHINRVRRELRRKKEEV